MVTVLEIAVGSIIAVIVGILILWRVFMHDSGQHASGYRIEQEEPPTITIPRVTEKGEADQQIETWAGVAEVQAMLNSGVLAIPEWCHKAA